jgi:ferredoxin
MRVSVNNEICEAHGQCNTVDADLFTLDDEGYSNIGTGKEVPPGREAAAEQGVDVCPVQALRIEK